MLPRRIDVSPDLEKKLDEVKQRNYIYHKGHSETIRWLVEFYEKHESLEKLIDNKLSNIDQRLRESILRAFKQVITNILGGQ